MSGKSFVCRPLSNGGIEIGWIDERGQLDLVDFTSESLSEVLLTLVTVMTEASPPSEQTPAAGPIKPVQMVEPTAIGVGHSEQGRSGLLLHFGEARLAVALPSNQLVNIGQALVASASA
jgi:hypothetical protein